MTKDFNAYVHLNALRENGYIVKAWQLADVLGVIEDNADEYGQGSPEANEELAERVWDSGYVESLNDCTESDWLTIEYAIQSVLGV